NFIYFNFAGDAVAVKLDNRSSKTIRRRGTNSGAFEVPGVFGWPIAAGGAQRAVLFLGLGHCVSEAYATFGEACAANLAVGEFEIVRRYFQRFTCGFEQQGFELA